MDIVLSFFFTLLGAILGTLFSFLMSEPQKLPRWIALNKRTSWKGIWLCAWFPKLPNENSWVLDKVKLTHKFGKLHIESYESAEGYEWEASLTLKGLFLIGEWKSLKPNSTSKGTMQLKISNQGNVIYGISTGPHIDDRLVTFKFVFSDSEKELQNAINNFDKII